MASSVPKNALLAFQSYVRALYKAVGVSAFIREHCICRALEGSGFAYGIAIHKVLRDAQPKEIVPNELNAYVDAIKAKSSTESLEAMLLDKGWTKGRLNSMAQLVSIYQYMAFYGIAMRVDESNAARDVELMRHGVF